MSIANNLSSIHARIKHASNAAGQVAPPQLVAVSKKHSIAAIEQAYACGQRHFGENYLQEALGKVEALNQPDIVWHFIGPIQSNKCRAIAEHFQWAHTVDRIKVATRLSDQRPGDAPPLDICLQVNIDNEASKSGLLPGDVLALAEAVSLLPHLRLRGLMAIPSSATSKDGAAFRQLKKLFDDIQSSLNPPHWDTLSMGMSGDLEAAISAGATMVRIGTDIFGARE